MRAFIAIKIPEDLARELDRGNGYLKSNNYKPVEPYNMHLTLKFLGEVSYDKLKLLKEIIEKKIRGFGKFEFCIKGVGAFPSPTAARVVWFGVGQGGERLKKLADLIEEIACEIGFKRESREFNPHLTLGRLKRPRSISETLEKLKVLYGGKEYWVEAKEIIFFKSTLTPKGPIYEEVFKVEL
jgi:2'-5' RNA ligase